MADGQSNTPIPFSPRPSPLRRYAAEAIEAMRDDSVRGVLQWRIAQFLLNQQHTLQQRPTARLEAVPPRERIYFVTLASTVLAMTEAIASTEPPTPSELLAHERRRLEKLAMARARHDAERLRHQLDSFRPAEPGYLLALCRRCRAGVSIHVDTGGISASELLTRVCEQ